MSDTVTEIPVDTSVAVTGAEVTEDTSSESTQEGSADESFEAFKARMEGKESSPKSKPKPEPKEPSEPKETKPEPKVWKLKVDGQEIEFDASDEASVQRVVQKGLASDRKFQEAAKIRSQAENFVKMLKENPLEVLKHPSLGLNFRELAENFLYEQLQAESISPEEKQATSEREELERYRRQEQETKQQQQTKQQEELKEQYRQDYQAKFIEALDTAGLPKSDWSVTRMATLMREAISRGLTNITPKDVAHIVKQDWISAQQEMYGSLDGAKLVEMLGKDVAEKIRLHDVSQFKAKNSQPPAPGKVGNTEKKSSKKQYSSIEDMLEDM
jgi:hypothetical protein